MDGTKTSRYFGWTVARLKQELTLRKAVLTGKKEDLIARLEGYDRNDNFKGEAIIIPEYIDPDWPVSGFQQLQLSHREQLPRFHRSQITGYFTYREVLDSQPISNVKAIEKGQKLYESDRIHACSVNILEKNICFSGIVGAAMKKTVTYSYKVKLDRNTSEILNSDCECPAGKGPHATCKHVAAVLLMLFDFVNGNDPKVQRSCTDILQTFHKPKKRHNGSPMKAEEIPSKQKAKLHDPRAPAFRGLSGTNDRVRNIVLNHCVTKSHNLCLRYFYDKANVQAIGNDHDYIEKPVLQQWVDNAVYVTEEKQISIEKKTRAQAKSEMWKGERLWRVTASRFGEICKITVRRNHDKLCQSFMSTSSLNNCAINHGKQYESVAVERFEERSGMKVKPCGLFVCQERPYLAATPDGVIDGSTILEVKCPYKGRESEIVIGDMFPYLASDDGILTLKRDSNYYHQIQGQMYISKTKVCYFVIYTFKDLLVERIEIDTDFCEGSMIPKLELFYSKYLRPYIANHM